MKIRLVVPVLYSEALVEKARKEYQACASPGVEISVACLPNGTRSIESDLDMALAQPEVIRLVRQAEAEGIDGCAITCFGDPGAAGAKEAVSIPVVGEGEAAMLFAGLLGMRFSIVITQREIFPLIRRLVHAAGAEQRLASIREVKAGVLDFSRECLPIAIGQAIAAVREDEADAIVMGCTGTGFDMAQEIESALKQQLGTYVPVIDPSKVTMKLVEALVSLRMAHSKVAYPTPPSLRPEYRFAAS
jgi:allantoin racemase